MGYSGYGYELRAGPEHLRQILTVNKALKGFAGAAEFCGRFIKIL